jgi:AraC-like DNA-binding protein
MSRSAFAARFSQLVGEPAVRYVTRWKMHAALLWLKEENAALSEVASRLGYKNGEFRARCRFHWMVRFRSSM